MKIEKEEKGSTVVVNCVWNENGNGQGFVTLGSHCGLSGTGQARLALSQSREN